MRKINYLASILIFVSIVFLTSNCKKNVSSPPSSSGKDSSALNLEINQFIWGGLNYWYLWVDSVPKLSSAYFNNNVSNLNSFLNGYTDHEKLFNDLLYPNLDHWSWIVDDYTVLENQLQGITKSFGFDFGLYYYKNDNTNVYGFVRYVEPNSPATAAGIKRGDIFTKVDDQQITVNNYQSLLFNNDNYKLSFDNVNMADSSLTLNGKETTLTAIEMQENPIFLDTVYTINGNKIGYLVYNGFYPDFDVQLNTVFQNFKNAGIQNLILDLRYNGGGSIQSAINLSSMIYGTDITKVFATSKFNSAVQADLNSYYGSNYFTDHFADTIARSTPAGSPTTITSLGLSQLYVITTGSTASASELVINGLKPYVNVVTIGTHTDGKYVGSITVKDVNSSGVVNPDHKWAMQPIVLKIYNSIGVSDYKNGFAPNVPVAENIYQTILPLGDTNEIMLKAALNNLLGLPQQSSLLKSASASHKIADSKDFMPHSKEMYRNLKSLNFRKSSWNKR
jgi:C-terminal processing protease CtpA/Prc